MLAGFGRESKKTAGYLVPDAGGPGCREGGGGIEDDPCQKGATRRDMLRELGRKLGRATSDGRDGSEDWGVGVWPVESS